MFIQSLSKLKLQGLNQVDNTLDTSDATIVASQMLSGQSAYINGVKVTGIMPNHNAQTQVSDIKTLVNLINNGSFESDFTGWGVNCSQPIITSIKKYGSKSIECTVSNGRNYCGCARDGIFFVPNSNSKYYMCGNFYVKSYSSGTPIMIMRAITEGTDVRVPIDITKLNQWQFQSFIFDTTGKTLNNIDYFALHDSGITTSTFDIVIDGFTIINLTATFGAGSEPTKEQMDIIMDTMGGWFDGTCILEKISTGAYITNGITGGPELLTASAGLKPSNILSGNNVLGVNGSIPVYWSDNGGDQLGAIGTTGWEGSAFMKVHPYSYLANVNWIRASIPDLLASNIASGKTIFNVTGTATMGKKYASGSGTSSSNTATVTGLSFTPRNVVITGGGNTYFYCTMINNNTAYRIPNYYTYSASVNSSGFVINMPGSGIAFTWYAWE